jgi:hypothetical protein
VITLFTIPKPFTGPFARIQRNALGSWRALGAHVEILVLGSEVGSAEAAGAIGARHIPTVETTSAGTPRVDAVFATAEQHATNDLVTYVNADIILLPDFLAAVERTAGRLAKLLIVGRRWDLDFEDTIDFADPGWEADLRRAVHARAVLHKPRGIDYFVFCRGLYREMPPFAVGRTMWDNWLIYSARAQHVPVVDATAAVTAVHQNHDYSHAGGGRPEVWKGPEAQRNMALAGGLDHYFTIDDATHRLRAGRLTRTLDWAHLRRGWHTLPVLSPVAGRLHRLARAVGAAIYRARRQVARWRGRI